MAKSAGSGLILGIESSCDETAAAVVRAGGEVLANVVASQIKLHANYGGVVPELASREHLRNIVPVVRAAMREASRVQPGLTFAGLDAIAVTEGPGLAGALLVGITYAKALALGVGKPLIAVNHLEGHIHAVLMEARQKHDELEMPLLALVVSGGHTHLYLAELEVDRGNPMFGVKDTPNMGHPSLWRYRNVGRTVDDAAGEAFDKVAKLLGLGYPGGPWMDALAGHGNPRAVEFKFGQIRGRAEKMGGNPMVGAKNTPNPSASSGQAMGHPESSAGHPESGRHFDFSFSGIKTAVLRYIQMHGMSAAIEVRRKALSEALKENPTMKANDAVALLPWLFDAQTLDLIASFQYAVVGNLIRQTAAAAEFFGVRGVVVSGGVSANSELRRRFRTAVPALVDFHHWAGASPKPMAARDLPVLFPTIAMSTDNAAMIAAAAWPKFVAGDFADEGLVAVPQLRLG